jgi:hypothetical protein
VFRRYPRMGDGLIAGDRGGSLSLLREVADLATV